MSLSTPRFRSSNWILSRWDQCFADRPLEKAAEYHPGHWIEQPEVWNFEVRARSGIWAVPVDVDAVRGCPVLVDFDEDGGGEALKADRHGSIIFDLKKLAIWDISTDDRMQSGMISAGNRRRLNTDVAETPQ
jgi:hypothetical protein